MEISELSNLGPKMQEWLLDIGIKDASQLLSRDPFDVYADLKSKYPQVSLNALYALIGAKEGRTWQDVKKNDKSAILYRLDDMGLAPKR